ncbi:hypothetical protein F2P81_015411 [Scophthalmus maximus]|uniref:TNFR-Cys domain-containing protein n=1 Tax=Scophthalmus maximus TaxID=52904 RepID=A0A6A4SPX6_SCOMX|nr:hypothetical protein F2P81_015411 [Scophthalmus maximus]
MRLQTPCTDSNDAICACNYNYFFNGISGRCEPCTVCPTGEGVYTHCDHDHDTVCEECVDDTFSDRESSLEPCLPCTICDEETEVQLGVCAPTYDSVCHTLMTRTKQPTAPESVQRTRVVPDCKLQTGCQHNSRAALEIITWNSCKQNKQAANNRAATNNQMVTPEGEKLHSDSGISVDSQSLQEQQQQQQQQQQHSQAEVQTQPSHSHTQEQIENARMLKPSRGDETQTRRRRRRRHRLVKKRGVTFRYEDECLRAAVLALQCLQMLLL